EGWKRLLQRLVDGKARLNGDAIFVPFDERSVEIDLDAAGEGGIDRHVGDRRSPRDKSTARHQEGRGQPSRCPRCRTAPNCAAPHGGRLDGALGEVHARLRASRANKKQTPGIEIERSEG